MSSSYNVSELFANNLSFKGKPVPVSDLKDKVVAVYFSAHWCPPCRAFTPTLISAYTAAKNAGAPIELVFVSSDEDQEGFDEYTKNMPWPSVNFSDEEGRSKLGEQFGIKGIPQLVIIGRDGKVITTEGRGFVSKDKEQAFQNWAKQ